VGYAPATKTYSPDSVFKITFHGVPVTQNNVDHSDISSFTCCANFPLSTQVLNEFSSHQSSLLTVNIVSFDPFEFRSFAKTAEVNLNNFSPSH